MKKQTQVLLLARMVRLQRGQMVSFAARKAGINRTVLSEIELGLRRPSDIQRKRLAAHYGIDEALLFEDVDAALETLRIVAAENPRRLENVEKQATG